MKKLKAILIDDEQIARDVLSNYLNSYCAEKVEIIAICDGFESAVKTLNTESPDLVFLDVEMPFGNGLDVLESIGDYNFKVVFTTAFDQYALDALNKHAFDYLLKPISIKKLIKTVDDAYNQIKNEQKTTNSYSNSHFKITSPTGFEIIKQESIIYAKASDNYTELFIDGDKQKLISKTLKKVEAELNEQQFIRIHKSYLVNTSKIIKYLRNAGGTILLTNNTELPISSNGKKILNNLFK